MTPATTLTYGLRYDFMSPLIDVDYTNSNLDLSSGKPQAFISGQIGYPYGLMFANRTNFAPRMGLAQNFLNLGVVAHVAYRIFYTPVDMNTWFNPSAFIAPPAYTYGDAGRNTVYGPGMQTMDLALVRNFSLTKKALFETRAEFFYALNHTNLGPPNRFVNTSSFGSITEVSTPGRENQLSTRVGF